MQTDLKAAKEQTQLACSLALTRIGNNVSIVRRDASEWSGAKCVVDASIHVVGRFTLFHNPLLLVIRNLVFCQIGPERAMVPQTTAIG